KAVKIEPAQSAREIAAKSAPATEQPAKPPPAHGPAAVPNPIPAPKPAASAETVLTAHAKEAVPAPQTSIPDAPASAPASAAQSAVATPPGSLFGGKTLWLGASILAVSSFSLVVFWLARRTRPPREASVITRSLD